MEFCIRKVLNESKFPHGPMSHALGHLWGEGQKYVPNKVYFLIHSSIYPISFMKLMFSQIWNAFLTYICVYIKLMKLFTDTQFQEF